MTHIIALISGTLFGAGLAVSGMHDPARILSFLDLKRLASSTVEWDGTLGLVLASALVVTILAEAIRRRTIAPVAAHRYFMVPHGKIDQPLVWGSILFGLGWGLVGLCPGPVIAAFAVATVDGARGAASSLLIFFIAMMVGIAVARPIVAGSNTDRPVADLAGPG